VAVVEPADAEQVKREDPNADADAVAVDANADADAPLNVDADAELNVVKLIKKFIKL